MECAGKNDKCPAYEHTWSGFGRSCCLRASFQLTLAWQMRLHVDKRLTHRRAQFSDMCSGLRVDTFNILILRTYEQLAATKSMTLIPTG